MPTWDQVLDVGKMLVEGTIFCSIAISVGLGVVLLICEMVNPTHPPDETKQPY